MARKDVVSVSYSVALAEGMVTCTQYKSGMIEMKWGEQLIYAQAADIQSVLEHAIARTKNAWPQESKNVLRRVLKGKVKVNSGDSDNFLSPDGMYYTGPCAIRDSGSKVFHLHDANTGSIVDVGGSDDGDSRTYH